MKMVYSAPEIEISVFTTEDIITASNTSISATPLDDQDYDTTYDDLFD